MTGDIIAFYLSDDPENFFAGVITKALPSGRAHIRVFEPNGASVRRQVERVDGHARKYRWAFIEHAQELLQ